MENLRKVCKLMVFLSLLACSFSMRVKRRAGDQSSSGFCTTYKWGGDSGLHWYACCNNCESTDNSCDSKTYQSASSTSYCGQCGTDTTRGDGKFSATYSCGGCQGQSRTSKKCVSGLQSVYQIPGFCWAFSICFKNKCRARSRSLGLVQVPDTCFNLRCDPGETVDNCPTDCCGTKNAKCDWGKLQKCVPLCCSESTCCNDTSGSDGRVVSMTTYYTCIVIMIKFALTN